MVSSHILRMTTRVARITTSPQNDEPQRARKQKLSLSSLGREPLTKVRLLVPSGRFLSASTLCSRALQGRGRSACRHQNSEHDAIVHVPSKKFLKFLEIARQIQYSSFGIQGLGAHNFSGRRNQFQRERSFFPNLHSIAGGPLVLLRRIKESYHLVPIFVWVRASFREACCPDCFGAVAKLEVR